ncbi:nitrate/nitrite transporter [Flavobacterium chuncheonense]|uniref:Nitrate/nitrite transporter n=1 Tax=Flavobacterium chuncheonense TaxID=2026653 RepID=A0ABW5YPB5_9FLAO
MKWILPLIVISQFLCTSLWFAGNSIVSNLIQDLQLDDSFLAHITSVIQFGFISGTLFFAIFTISDRYSPSLVFFISSIMAGLFNIAITLPEITPTTILMFRFLTGFFLAGIYPVGMKIASDYYRKGLGKSLGFLVGALVIGTAFPHLIKNYASSLSWKYVLYITSILSLLGGSLIFLFVPNGPYRKISSKMNFSAFVTVFKNNNFRSAAFGYFGHMWELYSFWAFVPVMLKLYNTKHVNNELPIALLSFFIIAIGGLACVTSGLLSLKLGPKKVATAALSLSCLCCIVSPLFLSTDSIITLLSFLFFWSFVVIADSPLFSTLVAQNAPEATRGTSLTIVNCIGFAITIISIQTINALANTIAPEYLYLLLAIGPILGLTALIKKSNKMY